MSGLDHRRPCSFGRTSTHPPVDISDSTTPLSFVVDGPEEASQSPDRRGIDDTYGRPYCPTTRGSMTIDLATPADDKTVTGTGGQDGGANSTIGASGYGTFNVTTSANGTVNGTYWQPWGTPDHAGRPLNADIIACAVITWLIALTFVALRFYTRTKLNNVLGPADWCLIPSLVFSAAVSASAIEQAVKGAGLHAWEVDTLQLPALERAAFYGIIFYSLSLAFTRISILLLYRRIFTYSWTKRAIQVGIVAVPAIGLWHVVSVCTACVPLAAFWDWSYFWIPGKKVYCHPVNVWWVNAALHLGTDLFIMALPMPALSRVKLPRRQKIALVGVFALGFFVCIVSVLRLLVLIENNRQFTEWLKTYKPFDSTYNMPTLMYWTNVEVNAAITCACIMTLKPLIQRLFPRLLSTGSRYIYDRSLPWITPIHSTHSRSIHSRRGSMHSFAHPHSRTHRRHGSNATATSPMSEMKPGGEGALSSVDEYDNYDRRVYNELFRKEAALRISDLEARGVDGGGGGGSGSGMSTASTQERENRGSRKLGRDRDQDSMSMTGISLGGTVSHQHHDTSDGDDGEDFQLRAPPRAHLRLSIHVTKSIHVTRSPPSNSATSCDKLDDAADMQGNGNQIWGELRGEQPGEMEMGAAFSRSRPSSAGDPRCAPPREIAGRSGDQVETVQRDGQHPVVSAP